ncbi:MAG: DUF192 domain-containing protein [Novosphingobium sp.]|nr:DUF192 domain-containing protein [Novosphingobium sp.]
MRTGFAALALSAALAACSSSASDGAAAGVAATEPARHPVSGLQVIPLTVIHEGKRHRFRVEIAGNPYEQAKGLMFRTEMGADEGMLFPMKPPRNASFWMKNTVIPLDIIFVGQDRRIINIAADAVPYSEENLESQGLAAAVLELNGGRAAELGIGPGDKVEW